MLRDENSHREHTPADRSLTPQRRRPKLAQLQPPGAHQTKLVICDHTIDITYVRLRWEFVYLAVIMHVFTRGIRGRSLGRSLDHQLTLMPLNQALAGHRAPEIHHSDQGVQYVATAYTNLLTRAGVCISMAETSHPEQNGYA